MTLTSPAIEQRKAQDAKILSRVQRRLLRVFRELRVWRKVAAEIGVNHGYLSRVMRGEIPTNKTVRLALGFPAVLPSERKPRVKKPDPPRVWEDGWEDVYLRKIKRKR